MERYVFASVEANVEDVWVLGGDPRISGGFLGS